MSTQWMAALVMFMITVGVTSVFCYPPLKFQNRNEVVNFYWTGFWVFLACLVATAGSQSALRIVGLKDQAFSNALLRAVSVTFVLFVMFAWFRLISMGATTFLKKGLKTNKP